MGFLFFDTETTGVPPKGVSSPADPRQPHLVQLAFIFAGDESTLWDAIVRPEGYEIPEGAANVHGITTQRALAEGIPLRDAVAPFVMALNRAHTIVAHNTPFDVNIMRTAMYRGGFLLDKLDSIRKIDTCKLSTPIVKLPPTERMLQYGYGPYKSAKLEEAYEFFTGKPLENAHDAMADVQGCVEVYKALMQRGAIPA